MIRTLVFILWIAVAYLLYRQRQHTAELTAAHAQAARGHRLALRGWLILRDHLLTDHQLTQEDLDGRIARNVTGSRSSE